jgi:predicted SAM-dependent methyltransferase
MRKVEIGPSSKKIGRDWVTVGLKSINPNIDIACSWGHDAIPLEDNSVDLVYASHVLEHIEWYNTISALKEVYRILKPGGLFEVHVPDFAKIVEAFINKKCMDSNRNMNLEGNYMKWINNKLYCHGSPDYLHKATFDENFLRECLVGVGFNNIESGIEERTAKHQSNLGMRGEK